MRIVVYGSKSFILSNDTAYGLMMEAKAARAAGNIAKAKALVAKAVKAEG